MPEYAPAYSDLAHLYGLMGSERARAIQLAQKAARLDPNSEQAYNTLSWLQYIAGNFDESEEAIRKSMQLNPENPVYREGLAAIQKARRQMSNE